jgi:hypothetical protein
MFLLPCVGSDLATRLIPRPRSPTNCLQDPQFHINSDGKRAKELNPSEKGEEEEEKLKSLETKLKMQL